jgi:hypothetical protein
MEPLATVVKVLHVSDYLNASRWQQIEKKA